MNVVKRNLREAYIAKWNEQLWNDNRTCQNGGNKLRTYRIFKTVFAWEFYLSRITVRCHLIAMARFRTSCHSLAIETGRHHKPPIPPEQRLCLYCNSGKVDDEVHFLIECDHLQYYRGKLYETAVYYNAQFINMSHTEKMCYLFETSNTPTIRKLAWYIYSGLEYRKWSST